ncbi:MAG: tetratricopeptide repeat protein [Chloroflexota bacterium]
MKTFARSFALLCLVWAALSARPVRAAPPAETPDELLVSAEMLRVGGNYPAAIAAYQKLLDAAITDPFSPDAPTMSTALYRLAQTYALDENYAPAVEQWQRFLRSYPDDSRRPLAFLQLANTSRAAQNLPLALSAYQAYRAAVAPDDPLLPYVAVTLGNAYRDAGQYALAMGEYRAVVAMPTLSAGSGQAVLPVMRTLTAQQLGETLAKTGDNAGALQAFDVALQLAQTANTRSQLHVAAARALKELGRTDEAIARYKQVLSEMPDGAAAPQAVEQLLALAPSELNFYQAGLAYYNRRQYETAVNWFHRYLDEQNDLDLAHYYAARAYENNSQQDKAIREWTVLIDTHPTSSKLAEAMYERADDYHRLGQDAVAIRYYQQLATRFAGTRWAEDGLFAIARMDEEAAKYLDAARQYEALQARYPAGARAAEALAAAGLTRYRANDFAGARVTLERLAANYPPSIWKAKGLFWLGKVLQQQGLHAEAKARWLQAYEAKPDDYYAMRAQDMALGTMPLGNERQKFSMPTAFAGDQRQMENWLRQWAALPDDDIQANHRLSMLRPELAADVRMQRARLLVEVGMRNEARAELRHLADQYKDDPIAQYQLGIVCNDLGLYDLVIRTAYRILALSPNNDLNFAPDYLQRMAYPAPFTALVVNEAQKNGFDPLLYFGLLWQESQFDPTATSFVGARGLGQVMPGTGGDIASALKRGGFKPADLYKPYVAAEFGAYYFARTVNYLDHDFMMALAGYNAGPGNAANWKNADVDIGVENVQFFETRTYVRRVYQHYWYYRHLYSNQ